MKIIKNYIIAISDYFENNYSVAKLCFIFIIGISILSCSGLQDNITRIRIVGSDTMYYLTIRLAAEYMDRHPETALYVSGGGSSAGFEAIQKQTADICMSSRNIRFDEVKTLAENYSTIGMAYLIAKDALSVFVNQNNPVDSISTDQLHSIFTCKITNWSDLGNYSDSIMTITRTKQSGTYEYFKSHILNDDDFCENAIFTSSTESMIKIIRNNINSIGYGGIAFQAGIKHLKINGIEPNVNNVRNDTYPIIRYLNFYTVKSPKGEVKKFIDWVMSSEGQDIIDKFGFISIWN